MRTSANNRNIIYWLLSGAILILAMVVIGGITRLTGSGLSIVEWNLISGTLPPLSHAAWLTAFEKYKQFPEYQKLNMHMTLTGFQQIFWWEYLHRLLGRLIGVVFILPFLYFVMKGQVKGWLLRRLLFILALGMAQGLMGWLMVKSGLVDNPHVSHFRLAAHLCLALSLIGVILWTVADLIYVRSNQRSISASKLRLGANFILAAIAAQIILGAFVAGLKAGFSYNTYPLMQGEFFPSGIWQYVGWQEMLENGVVMQFAHRWVAILVLIAIAAFTFRVWRGDSSPVVKRHTQLLLLVCLAQVALGIVTLLLAVPVSLGVLHQVIAVVLFAVALLLVHRLKYAEAR